MVGKAGILSTAPTMPAPKQVTVASKNQEAGLPYPHFFKFKGLSIFTAILSSIFLPVHPLLGSSVYHSKTSEPPGLGLIITCYNDGSSELLFLFCSNLLLTCVLCIKIPNQEHLVTGNEVAICPAVGHDFEKTTCTAAGHCFEKYYMHGSLVPI